MRKSLRRTLAALLLSTALVAAPQPAYAMPAAIGAVAAFAATPIGGALISIGAGFLFQQIGNLFSSPTDEPPQKRQKFGAQLGLQVGGVHPLSFPMGWTAVEGQRIYVGSWKRPGGTPNAFITDVRLISDIGYADELVPWVDDQRCTVDWEDPGALGQGYPLTNFRRGGKDYAWLRVLDGTQTTVDSFLFEKFGDHPDRPFGSDMIGKGQVIALITFRQNPKLWGSDLPSVLLETNGISLYNIAKDSSVGGSGSHRIANPATWEPSNNPIVQGYNLKFGLFVNGQWIYGGQNKKPMPVHRLPVSNWIAAINACDINVETAGGGSEPKYRAGGVVNCDMQAADYLEKLYESCHARFTESGGLFKVRVGGPGTAVYAFTDASIVASDGQTFDPFPPLESRFNAVEATYPERRERWNMRPAPGRYNAAYEAIDGGRQLPRAVSFPLVPYRRQIQRLTKPIARADRRWRTYEVTFPPDAWPLEAGDAIVGTSTFNGYDTKRYEVLKKTGRRNLNQRLTIREIDASDWDYDKDVDEVDAPVGNLVSVSTPVQTVEEWSASSTTVLDDQGRKRRLALHVEWDEDLDGVTAIHIEAYKKDGDDEDPANNLGDRVLASHAIPSTLGEIDIPSGAWLPLHTYLTRIQYVVLGQREVEWSDFIEVTMEDIRFTVEDVNDAFRAVHGLVDGTGSNSLDLVIARLRDELNDYANSLARSLMFSYSQSGDLSALVAQEADTRADQDQALASLINQVSIQAGEVSAAGLIVVEAQAPSQTPADATVRIAVLARKSVNDDLYETGLLIDLLQNNSSRIVLKADKFIVTDGTNNTQPLTFQNGLLTIDRLGFNQLVSNGAEKLKIVGGNNPSIRMELD